MKLIVQRLVQGWIEDVYEVDEINEEIIDKAINYEIDYDTTEALYDSMEELGPVEVYDENWKLLKKNNE